MKKMMQKLIKRTMLTTIAMFVYTGIVYTILTLNGRHVWIAWDSFAECDIGILMIIYGVDFVRKVIGPLINKREFQPNLYVKDENVLGR